MKKLLNAKVTFNDDTPDRYHLNVCTTISMGDDNKNELWLSTISRLEAMLICMYFTKQQNTTDNTFNDLLSVEYQTGLGNLILFVLHYPNMEKTKISLERFGEWYKKIYDEALDYDYTIGQIFVKLDGDIKDSNYE